MQCGKWHRGIWGEGVGGREVEQWEPRMEKETTIERIGRRKESRREKMVETNVIFLRKCVTVISLSWKILRKDFTFDKRAEFVI